MLTATSCKLLLDKNHDRLQGIVNRHHSGSLDPADRQVRNDLKTDMSGRRKVSALIDCGFIVTISGINTRWLCVVSIGYRIVNLSLNLGLIQVVIELISNALLFIEIIKPIGE
jgi:hypothetical protein